MEDIEKLQADLKAATEQVAALQAEKEVVGKEANELVAKLAAIQAEKEELEAKVAALEAAVPSTGNSAKIVVKPEPAGPPPTFTLDKKKYRFKLGGFNLGDGGVLATNAVKDQALLKRIVADFPGLVEEL
jgi:hypothetical protein